jgi:hypothetical protein
MVGLPDEFKQDWNGDVAISFEQLSQLPFEVIILFQLLPLLVPFLHHVLYPFPAFLELL